MRLPKFHGTTSYSTFLFSLTCFVAGYLAVRLFTLGRITFDDRDGPGFNPVSRMPDGRIGLSESAIGFIGLIAIGLGAAVLMGLAWIWLRIR